MRNHELSNLRGQRVLIFASTGGHLTQAVKWADRLQVSPHSTFVTFDSSQSRSLLENRKHVFVPYVPPRDWRRLVLALVSLYQQRRSLRGFECVLSTGAGIAMAGLPFALIMRRALIYIESVSRFDGPSFTGRVLQHLFGTRLYTQHEGYPRRWRKVKALLDDYELASVGGSPDSAPDRPLRVFVTLGTIRPYRFDRLLEALLPALRPSDEVVWQLGETTRSDLPGRVHSHLNAKEFEHQIAACDVVVTHAGVGTLMALLDAGHQPVVMARLSEHAEHVDNHQTQVASYLSQLGLVREVSAMVTRGDLTASAGARIRSSPFDSEQKTRNSVS